jgi:hypothetical protein
MRARRPRLAVSVLFAVVAGSSHAATFCIDVGGSCDVSLTGAAGFQTALNAAEASPEADVVRLGVGTYVGEFFYTPTIAAGTLAIVGAGIDQTVLTALAPSTGLAVVLILRRDLIGSTPTVSRLTVVVSAPTGTAMSRGISTEGIVEDVRVAAPPGVLGGREGIALRGTGSGVRRSIIDMGTAAQASALVTTTGFSVTPDPSPAFFEDSSALNGMVTIEAFAPLRVTRARISARGDRALRARGTTVTVENTLVLADDASGLSALAENAPGVLRARHVTVVSVGAFPAFAGMDVDSGNIGTATMDVSHSIFVGFQHASFRSAGLDFTATLAVSASVFARGTDLVQGAGDTTLSEPQANLDVDPLLTEEFRLQDGSPAIDAAFSPALAGSESATDLDGMARIQDGNGDGIAARDMGAFEHPAVPVVSTTTTIPGCTDEVAFPSVRCRLGMLATAAAAGVPPGPLATKLAVLVTRAADRVAAAETARAGGRTKAARKALGKAAKALAAFARRLNGRAADGLDPSVASALSTSAGAIREDVRALRALG